MKFIHLSDLHLGKRLNEFSLIEDQRHVLTQILSLINEVKPNGIIIAGDVYDKSIPLIEAVGLLDDFLYQISTLNLPIYLIGGNHDGQERLSFGGRLLKNNELFISHSYAGELQKCTLLDEFGKINVYLLPFVKPSAVKRFFPEEEINGYTDAIKLIIQKENVNVNERNVLVAHQFVTGASLSGSEDIIVGGLDNVDSSVFACFDYVALGHIHSAQNVTPNVRYCGTPLKYSFSEVNHQKSLTVVELKEKGVINLSTLPLTPLRDLVAFRGKFEEIINFPPTTNYVKVTLTDEEDILDGANKLRVIFPNLMKIEYDNARTRRNAVLEAINDIENKTPLQLFSEFYYTQNNNELSAEQTDFLSGLIEDIWEEQV